MPLYKSNLYPSLTIPSNYVFAFQNVVSMLDCQELELWWKTLIIICTSLVYEGISCDESQVLDIALVF